MMMGDESDPVDIIRLTQDGENLFTQGNKSAAITEFEKAHELALKTEAKDTIEACSYNLAAAYAMNRDGQKAVNLFQKISTEFNDTVDVGELTFLYTLAKQYQGLKKNKLIRIFLKAHSQIKFLGGHNLHKKYILEQLCELERDLTVFGVENSRNARAEHLRELAKVYGQMKMPYEKNKMLYEVADEHYRMGRRKDAREMAELCWENFEDVQKALEEEKIVDEHDNDTHRMEDLVITVNNIGLLFTQLGMYKQALDCFKRGRTLVESGTKDEAVLLQNIGAVYNFWMHQKPAMIPSALKYHELAIEKYGEQSNKREQVKCYLNKANAQAVAKDPGAEESYSSALELAKASGDVKTHWQTLEDFGTFVGERNQLDRARNYMNKALKLCLQDKEILKDSSAENRIFEKLKALGCSQKHATRLTRTWSEDALDTLDTTKVKQKQPSSLDNFEMKGTRPLSGREMRKLKVKRSGLRCEFEKVVRGLSIDTVDGSRTLRYQELSEETVSSTEYSSSAESPVTSESESESEKEEHWFIPPKKAVQERRSKTPVNNSASMKLASSSGVKRRESRKALSISLFTISDDEDKATVRIEMMKHPKQDSDEEDDVLIKTREAEEPKPGTSTSSQNAKSGSQGSRAGNVQGDDGVEDDERKSSGKVLGKHATSLDPGRDLPSGGKSARFRSPLVSEGSQNDKSDTDRHDGHTSGAPVAKEKKKDSPSNNAVTTSHAQNFSPNMIKNKTDESLKSGDESEPKAEMITSRSTPEKAYSSDKSEPEPKQSRAESLDRQPDEEDGEGDAQSGDFKEEARIEMKKK